MGGNTLRPNWSTKWKTEWTHLLRYCQSVVTVLAIANILEELLHLLHHRFQQWCIFIANSNMVSKLSTLSHTVLTSVDFETIVGLKTKHIWIENIRLPFDWKNPMGYMCASAIQFMVYVCMFSLMASLLSVGIGAFLFAVRATNDITANLKLINESTKTKQNLKNVPKYISDFVQYHGDVKELSELQNRLLLESIFYHNDFICLTKCSHIFF